MLVGNQLDFDVTRLDNEFFDEYPRIAKSGLGLTHCGAHAVCEIIRSLNHPHALATTTGRGLDHNRKADIRGGLQGGIDILNRARRARHNRHTDFFSKCL